MRVFRIVEGLTVAADRDLGAFYGSGGVDASWRLGLAQIDGRQGGIDDELGVDDQQAILGRAEEGAGIALGSAGAKQGDDRQQPAAQNAKSRPKVGTIGSIFITCESDNTALTQIFIFIFTMYVYLMV